ncbi:PucR family transcriptional regulator [Paeniglutamicibacter sp. R2-26]|uniref:PucR family transcriptional regulator n=1 Tax=Paeniglutamicibacter sp. R2-26 TaxID=3144417 RepID=UPI003EE4D0A2
MPVTVADLIARPEFNLNCVAGHAALGNQVGWVHVSEVLDPTPWLQGGEFLINSMLERREGAALEHYFDSLLDMGIAALGCGIGVTYPRVPQSWRDLADSRGIPLIEIPLETPYIAISQFVVSRQADEQRKQFEMTLAMQAELATTVVTEQGALEVPRLLARMLSGWAAIVEADGSASTLAGAGARESLAAIAPDISRYHRMGGLSAGSVIYADREALIYPLGAGPVKRLLAVGRGQRFDPFERVIASTAASLLTLAAARSSRISPQERRLRELLLHEMKLGDLGSVYGIEPHRPVEVAVVLGLATRSDPDLDYAESTLGDLRVRAVSAAMGPDRTVFIAQHLTDGHIDWAEAGMPSPGQAMGLRRGLSIAELERSLREADTAARHARSMGEAVVDFEELGGLARVRSTLDEFALNATAAFRDEVFAHADTETIAALESYLSHNGGLAAAADSLGIHRQTLRSRLQRASEMFGIDLESPDDRAALWLTIRARGADG